MLKGSWKNIIDNFISHQKHLALTIPNTMVRPILIAISCGIRFFNCSRLVESVYKPLSWDILVKKSRGVRSGESTAHGMSSWIEMSRPGKIDVSINVSIYVCGRLNKYLGYCMSLKGMRWVGGKLISTRGSWLLWPSHQTVLKQFQALIRIWIVVFHDVENIRISGTCRKFVMEAQNRYYILQKPSMCILTETIVADD